MILGIGLIIMDYQRVFKILFECDIEICMVRPLPKFMNFSKFNWNMILEDIRKSQTMAANFHSDSIFAASASALGKLKTSTFSF